MNRGFSRNWGLAGQASCFRNLLLRTRADFNFSNYDTHHKTELPSPPLRVGNCGNQRLFQRQKFGGKLLIHQHKVADLWAKSRLKLQSAMYRLGKERHERTRRAERTTEALPQHGATPILAYSSGSTFTMDAAPAQGSGTIPGAVHRPSKVSGFGQ